MTQQWKMHMVISQQDIQRETYTSTHGHTKSHMDMDSEVCSSLSTNHLMST